MPFLVATIPSGGALLALELASPGAWLFMGKGLVVLAKLLILLMVPFFWEHRVFLLLLTVAVASVGSHMPSRFRHRCLLPALQRSCPPSQDLSSKRASTGPEEDRATQPCPCYSAHVAAGSIESGRGTTTRRATQADAGAPAGGSNQGGGSAVRPS